MSTNNLSTPASGRFSLSAAALHILAMVLMLMDHLWATLLPAQDWLTCAGRLAFPIFAYCLTVGLLYTRDIRKYLLRLGAFALISQPFYIFAFHPWDWQAEWMNMNIFFTLLVSLLALWGVHTRRWWLFLALFLLASFVNFDYSANGIVLMLIFYLCRNRRVLGAAVYVLFWLPALWGGQMEDPLSVKIAGHAINWTIFAVLSAFPIFLPTHTGIKVPKWFFYAFYPAHFAAIGLARVILNV